VRIGYGQWLFFVMQMKRLDVFNSIFTDVFSYWFSVIFSGMSPLCIITILFNRVFYSEFLEIQYEKIFEVWA